MDRALQLVRGFRIPAFIVINKADIHSDLAESIEREAEGKGVTVLGRIPYDPAVIKAMVQRRCVVEDKNGLANESIRRIWERLESLL